MNLEISRYINGSTVTCERLEPCDVRVGIDIKSVIKYQGRQVVGKVPVQHDTYIAVSDAGRFTTIAGVISGAFDTCDSDLVEQSQGQRIATVGLLHPNNRLIAPRIHI